MHSKLLITLLFWIYMQLPIKSQFSEASPYDFFFQDYFFIFFDLVRKGDKYRFNLYLGDKNNKTNKIVDIFVWPEEVPDLFKAIFSVICTITLERAKRK